MCLKNEACHYCQYHVNSPLANWTKKHPWAKPKCLLTAYPWLANYGHSYTLKMIMIVVFIFLPTVKWRTDVLTITVPRDTAKVWTHLLLYFLLDLFQIGPQVHGHLVFGAQQGLEHGVCWHAHLLQGRLLKLALQVLHFQSQILDLCREVKAQINEEPC